MTDRRFAVHMRCTGCVKPSTKFISVPRVEGAPSTVDEFEESLALLGVPFHCPHCDSNIASIISVTMESDEYAI